MSAKSIDNTASRVTAVVLLSGGVDSAALLHFLHSREPGTVRALHIDYGQPAHSHEFTAANGVATHIGVPLDLLTVGGLPAFGTGFSLGRNSLLSLEVAAFGQMALADYHAGLDRQGREQAGCAVPVIVVGATLGRAGPQRQHASLQSLRRTRGSLD